MRRLVKFTSPLHPTLLVAACAAFAIAALSARSADDATAVRPVQAHPPLEAVPTTPLTHAVQERMRQCNAQADKQKLQGAARETFVKGCMQPKRMMRPVASPTAR
jgi:hypothetical protein